MGLTDSTAQVISQATPVSRQIPDVSAQPANRWVSSARFLVAWLFPALLGFYLKWYMMTDQSGFAREAQSMGLRSLNFFERISFFRGELFYGALLIPLVFLILNRFLRPRWSAIFTGSCGLALSLLLGIQLLSLKELGRFSSYKMIVVGLSWGWHEPVSNAQYLMTREALAMFGSLVGIAAALAWAVRSANRVTSARVASHWKTAGELCVFLVVAVLLLSIKSDTPSSPYHQNSFLRAVTSLWKENAVETGEFAGLDMKRSAGLASADLTYLSDADLIARYGQLNSRAFARKRSSIFWQGSRREYSFFHFGDDAAEVSAGRRRAEAIPEFQSSAGKFVCRHAPLHYVSDHALCAIFCVQFLVSD